MDYYIDKRAAEDLILKSYEMHKSDYYKEEAELRTHKATFMDLGSGIAIASLVMLVFMVIKQKRTFRDLLQIKSIDKTSIYILSNILWLILIPGTFWYYSLRGTRGDYPPFADSIGLPIFTQIPLLLILMIPLNLFIGLTMIKSNIPTLIFIRPDKYTGRLLFWEIFFGFCLLLNLFYFVLFVVDGDHFSIPVSMFFTYLLLTLRAGQISRWTAKTEINASAQQRV
ncbi:MAG: hypothetical protein IPJ37_17455 [Bacteroidales bacterium]|nr:hypothetical protein [Bacteroidales bacterium]